MSRSRINLKRSKTYHRADWYTFWPVWALCAVLISFCIIGFVEVYLAERPQKSDVPVVSVGAGQDLHLGMGDLSSGKLHLYEVRSPGRRVKFVVQQTTDKTVHVALATCKACYRSENSHYVLDGKMMCSKCRHAMDFALSGEENYANQCKLSEISHTEENRQVTILERDVFDQASKLLR